jgi:hypothetical protein
MLPYRSLVTQVGPGQLGSDGESRLRCGQCHNTRPWPSGVDKAQIHSNKWSAGKGYSFQKTRPGKQTAAATRRGNATRRRFLSKEATALYAGTLGNCHLRSTGEIMKPAIAKWCLSVCLSLILYSEFWTPVGAAEVQQGRCHMNVCDWFKIDSQSTVGSSSDGVLIKAAFRWWQSDDLNGTTSNRPPQDGEKLTTEYFFCSRRAPAVLVLRGNTGTWTVTELAPGEADDIAGFNTTAYLRYFLVCHGTPVTEATLRAQTTIIGKTFGYHLTRNSDRSHFTVDHPEEMLSRGCRMLRQAHPGLSGPAQSQRC